MQRLLVSQLVLQFVIEVVDGCGLPLSSQVAFLQRGDSLLHVLFLGQSLGGSKGDKEKALAGTCPSIAAGLTVTAFLSFLLMLDPP